MNCAELTHGLKIPLFGLGTYKLRDPIIISSVLDIGLGCGYRLIDTAAVYKNEHLIGPAVKEFSQKHNLKEEDVFITSKLAPRDQGYDKALAAFKKSLDALGRSKMDLYLIHWPGAQGLRKDDPQNAQLRKESWRALEELYRSDKVKSIGVSNYTVRHLEEMRSYATIIPQVLQSECHPALPQKELRAYCRDHGIHFQAYSSLGCGKLIENDDVVKMARFYGKTPAQLLLRWGLEQGIGVIPKASKAERVRENCDVFDFEVLAEDVERLSSCFEGSSHYCWDPDEIA